MALRFSPSAFCPDRAPTWSEVALAVFVVLVFAPDVRSSTTSWPVVLLGFVAFAVALGPGANSDLGGDIGDWFRRIGVAGRAIVIFLFAITTGGLIHVGAVSGAIVGDVGTGGLSAVVLYTIVHVASAGGVSGWIPDRD